ncbi:hypothetical protein KSB_04990 [Ktedonobacter robiniae]|uniref:Uncharacterized protein n=1 Tax=Ktedonobacter robiniae TaxID=2778365 RepID=A0ABQ3UH43_9CHLR|nr:hypothetical protein KSB_04990 [Ktedonobacter robiniae]
MDNVDRPYGPYGEQRASHSEKEKTYHQHHTRGYDFSWGNALSNSYVPQSTID